MIIIEYKRVYMRNKELLTLSITCSAEKKWLPMGLFGLGGLTIAPEYGIIIM